MTDNQKKIINMLLNQYDKGKARLKVFPKSIYKDWKSRFFDVSLRESLLKEVLSLEKQGLVVAELDKKSGDLVSVGMLPEMVDKCFQAVNRKKAEMLCSEAVSFIYSLQPRTELGMKYVDRLKADETAYISLDRDKTRQFLSLLDYVASMKQEILERELSQIIFGDTKTIEKKYRKQILDLLCEIDPECKSIREQHGSSSEDVYSLVMEKYGVLKTPVSTMIKGIGVVKLIDGRVINIYSDFPLTITSDLLPKILDIVIDNHALITVENLTAFTRMYSEDSAVVYLGGYHNRIKQQVLVKIFESNRGLNEWYHSGDLDPDGVQILHVLREKTGVPFKPFLMEPNLIDKFTDYAREMSQGDIKLAMLLREKEIMPELLDKMISTGLKLEQEIVYFDRFAKHSDD